MGLSDEMFARSLRRGGFSTGPSSFFSSFGATENPISEGGAWVSGGIFSGRTDVQLASGNAYGTMTTFSGNFIDSCCHLSNWNAADHSIECTVHNSSAVTGLECELLLRCDITSGHVFAYEIDLYKGGNGLALVRWDATTATPNAYEQLRAYVSDEVPLAHGDKVYGEIRGTVIVCKYKPVAGSWSTIFTYDTAGDTTKLTNGKPGMGFWNDTGNGANSPNFAFSDFLATAL